MQKWIISCIIMTLCVVAVRVHAQDTYADKVEHYIAQYKSLAETEQRRSGIPAAVTLGQGILETDAGCSELVTGANNHFGIKCKKSWTGETFAHTDDAPNECFRKYKCAADSYKDHSEYLRTSPRYAALFKLSPTDYAAWAFGLKRCGYATSPTYAQRLINIIETFHLQEFTYQALGEGDGIADDANASAVPAAPTAAIQTDTTSLSQKDSSYTFRKHIVMAQVDSPVIKKADTVSSISPSAVADTAAGEMKDTFTAQPAVQQTLEEPAAPAPTHPEGVTKLNGLKALYVHKGDLLLQYAVKYNIRYAKLLEINDLTDAPVPQDMYIYLERKNIKGSHPTHIVKKWETMRSISQEEGVQMKRLLAYNRMSPGEEPLAGELLHLQTYAAAKPKVTKTPVIMKPGPMVIPMPKQDTATRKTNDMIVLQKTAEEEVKDAAPAAIPDSIKNLKPETEDVTNTTTIAGIPDSIKNLKPETDNNIADNNTSTAAVTNDPAPAPKPVVQESNPADNQTISTTNTPRTDAYSDMQNTAGTPETKQQQDKEDLDRLKAKLDKLVYASDEPSPAAPAPAPQLTPEQKKAIEKAAEDAKYYTVRGGDTAYSIARSHHITMHQLLEWNNLDFNQIKVGERLRVKP